jgi:hypothetical protein
MPRLVSAELVEPVVRGLLGSVDVDGGPTDEQLRVLESITTHLWQRPDLDLRSLSPLGPDETAKRVDDPGARRRFSEVMFAIEMCRHPLSESQVARCEAYSQALGASPEEVVVFRELVDEGLARAAADFDRFFAANVPGRAEVRFRELTHEPPRADPALVEQVERYHELGEETLGWHLADFYSTHGFTVPGSEISPNTYFYFAHDMILVISGIAPTGIGEVALGGFQMAMDDNPASTFAFFSPLVIHEAGFAGIDDIVAADFTLDRPYAAELLGKEMERGARTTADFAWVDHLELATRPLEEVRSRFGVVAPESPNDGHHIYW